MRWTWSELLIAGIIQAVIGLGITYLAKYVVRKALVPIREFGLKWRRLTAYGTLMLFGVFQLASTVGGFIASDAAPPRMELADEALYLSTINLWMVVFWGGPLLFFVGEWMGRRSIREMSMVHGALSVIVAGTLCALVSIALFLYVGSLLEVEDRVVEEVLSDVRGINIWVRLSSSMTLILVPALCGYLNGRRTSSGAYLAYLLRRVSQRTRDRIVRLAYEEAKKMRSSDAGQ